MLREIKPRNARTARIVKAREPQAIEDRKRTLLLHGGKCPQPVSAVLKTIAALTKPHSVLLNKKNENIHPFENVESLEFLANKNECGIVVLGAHSKKRPNNITLLRIYNGKVLDMVELLLLLLPTPVEALAAPLNLQVPVEIHPLILFAGSQWDDASASTTAATYRTLKSLFLDLFSGQEVSSVDVEGLQYLLMIATPDVADPGQPPLIYLRWYKVRTKKSGQKLPRVELDPVGPTFDFRVGRFREAEASVMKEALQRARAPNEARTKKNIEMDIVGDKIGKVHLGRQDLSQLQTRKMKGLKRGRDDSDDEGGIGDLDLDMENGGMELDLDEVSVSGDEDLEDDLVDEGEEDESGSGASASASASEIDDDPDNEMPKRQKLS